MEKHHRDGERQHRGHTVIREWGLQGHLLQAPGELPSSPTHRLKPGAREQVNQACREKHQGPGVWNAGGHPDSRDHVWRPQVGQSASLGPSFPVCHLETDWRARMLP